MLEVWLKFPPSFKYASPSVSCIEFSDKYSGMIDYDGLIQSGDSLNKKSKRPQLQLWGSASPSILWVSADIDGN